MKFERSGASSLLIVLPISLLLFFPQFLTPTINSGLIYSSGKSSYYLTRSTAIADFLQALQMLDGSFVAKLESPLSSAFIGTTYDGVVPLAALNKLGTINQDTTRDYVWRCQGSNGAIYPTPQAALQEGTPEIRSAAHAVTILTLLNGLNGLDTSALISFISACQRPDGGFNDQPSVSDYAIWNTYYAVSALLGIGATFSFQDVADSLMTYYNVDGGFSLAPGGSSDLGSTFYGVETLRLCSQLSQLDAPATRSYVLTFYDDESASFGNSLMNTLYGCTILNTLGNLALINTTGVGEFVLNCQSLEHGGFKSRPDAISEATSNCRRAVQCLGTLNLLSLLDAQITINEHPVWEGGTGTTPTTSPPPFPVIPLGLIILGCIGFVTITLTFVVFLVSPRNPKKKVKKIKKRTRTS